VWPVDVTKFDEKHSIELWDDRGDSFGARRFITDAASSQAPRFTMKNALFQLVLLALVLPGCASAVDDDVTLPPADEATESASQPLKGAAAPTGDAALDASAADCDAQALSTGVQAGSYDEFTSILEASSINLDSPGLAGNTCTRVCKCCKNNGNRFCCSHCRFCSGPIGVSDSVLAP
jgi:hypothetical protein